MGLEALKRASTPLMLGSALLFLVVLFLDWHRVSMEVAGIVDLNERSSGWSGWGIFAGCFAVALVALNLGRLRRGGQPTDTQSLINLVLAAGLLATTFGAVFGGEVDVAVATVGLKVDSTLWPSWVGVALAATTVVAAFVESLPEREVKKAVRPTLA